MKLREFCLPLQRDQLAAVATYWDNYGNICPSTKMDSKFSFTAEQFVLTFAVIVRGFCTQVFAIYTASTLSHKEAAPRLTSTLSQWIMKRRRFVRQRHH